MGLNYFIQCVAFAFASRGTYNDILWIAPANMHMVDPR